MTPSWNTYAPPTANVAPNPRAILAMISIAGSPLLLSG
jgi:hypothetical protein